MRTGFKIEFFSGMVPYIHRFVITTAIRSLSFQNPPNNLPGLSPNPIVVVISSGIPATLAFVLPVIPPIE
jgi:hypothetical protein